MTSEEWAHTNDPRELLSAVRKYCSPRKLRLIAIAFCRRVLHLLDPEDEHQRQNLEIAERYADGLVPQETLDICRQKVELTGRAIGNAPAPYEPEHYALGSTGDVVHPDAFEAADWTRWLAQNAFDPDVKLDSLGEPIDSPEQPIQAEIIRDIVGNPFEPQTLDAVWQTSEVMKQAQEIYEHSSFDDLPRLADALEAAGCENPTILAHCREGGLHVRGCWVVDQILGKE